jgi:hypothetical protein
MLDGYRSPGGSLLNMDALMMVGFAAIQPSMAAQSQHNMSMFLAKQQQVFMEEQNEMVRTSTAKLLLAQEELTQEAIRAKREISTTIGSCGPETRIGQLLQQVTVLTCELLEMKKKKLELTRELREEKDINKRPLLPGDNINQPDGKRIRADLEQESDITAALKGDTIKVNLQRDSEGNTSRTILPPSRKFPPATNQPGSVSTNNRGESTKQLFNNRSESTK